MTENPFASPLPKEDLPISAEIVDGPPIPESNGVLITILIFTLILGGMGLAGSLIGIVGLAFQSTVAEMQPTAADPMMIKIQELQQDQLVPNLIMFVLNLAVAPLLLVGGIGGLMRKRWAHRLLRIGIMCAIVFVLIRAIVGGVMQYQLMNELGAMMEQQAGGNQKEAAMMSQFMGIGLIIGIVFSFFYTAAFVGFYIWAWIYMNCEKARRYFDLPITGS